MCPCSLESWTGRRRELIGSGAQCLPAIWTARRVAVDASHQAPSSAQRTGAQHLLRMNDQGSFIFKKNYKLFQNFPSHQILRRIHKTLNLDKNN
jgi:hypothetical protein